MNFDKEYIVFDVPEKNKPEEKKLIELVDELGFTAREVILSEKPFPKGDGDTDTDNE